MEPIQRLIGAASGMGVAITSTSMISPSACVLMSAVIPLSLIAIGVLVFGESASLLRLCLLGGACVLVGLATAYG